MDKLSEFTGKTVFLKELELLGYNDINNPYDCRVKKEGDDINTEDAIKFIAFRKCVNMPLPKVYKDNLFVEELSTEDIKPKFLEKL